MPAPINCILIGCGAVGLKHLKAIRYYEKKGKLHLLSVVDPNVERVQKALAEIGFDLEAIKTLPNNPIVSSTPELVAIATPPSSHFALAKEALEAGSNVIIEKPMTLSTEQAQKLATISQIQDKKVALAHIYRYMPTVSAIKQGLANGTYGKVLCGEISAAWGHGQAYYDASPWRGTFEHEGGVLMNQGIHAVDLMMWLLGGKPVRATGHMARQNHKMEAEDLALGILEMSNGTRCTITSTTSTAEQSKQATFKIYTTEAIITATVEAGKTQRFALTVDLAGTKKKTAKLLWQALRHHVAAVGWREFRPFISPHTAIYANMIDALTTGTSIKADALSGQVAVEACLALYESARTGQTVTIGAQKLNLKDLSASNWLHTDQTGAKN